MEQKSVSVVILNWNGRQYLYDCLQSILNQTYKNYEVIIVYNGSSDGSQAFIRETYPHVRLIENSENLGFAEGTNIGIKAANGEYVITLNNDTKVFPNFIEEMVNVADSDERIGMIAAKMVNFYIPKKIDSVGIEVSKNGLGYNIGSGENDHGQYDESKEVFGPCAGAAVYKKKMLDEIGLFDEDFFAYAEDIDLAWRGRLAGWRCLTAPRAVVLHIHSATGGKYSKFKTYHTHRNKWWVLIKNWPLFTLIKYFPLIALYDAAASVLSMVYLRSLVSFKAKIGALRGLRKMIRKRSDIRAFTRISREELEALFRPAENPFATLKKKVFSSD